MSSASEVLADEGTINAPAHSEQDTCRDSSAVRRTPQRLGGRGLALFGSATREHFYPVTSDLDVLVEFQSMLPAPHADSYSGLMEDLQRLFGIPIDLVEPGSIRNPYVRQSSLRR